MVHAAKAAQKYAAAVIGTRARIILIIMEKKRNRMCLENSKFLFFYIC
jgi:hypothetical protein